MKNFTRVYHFCVLIFISAISSDGASLRNHTYATDIEEVGFGQISKKISSAPIHKNNFLELREAASNLPFRNRRKISKILLKSLGTLMKEYPISSTHTENLMTKIETTLDEQPSRISEETNDEILANATNDINTTMSRYDEEAALVFQILQFVFDFMEDFGEILNFNFEEYI